MRTIIANPSVCIDLGHAGESGVTTVIFDVVEDWRAEVGTGGTLQLLVQMDRQNAYPAAVELQTNKAVWVVTAAETARSGDGQAQLSYLLNGKVAKSACYSYTVLPSLSETAGAEPPEAVSPWYDHIEQMANEAHTAAIDAKGSAAKSAAAAKADADRAQAEADKVADKVGKSYVDQTFAPAIRETLVGTTVTTDMVSPVEHDLLCKAYSENLIPFPFREQPASVSGVSFKYENGTVTANGTASDNIYIGLLQRSFRMGAGLYAITGCPKVRGCIIQAQYDGTWGRYDTGDGVAFDAKKEVTGVIIQIYAGTTLNDAVFRPKLQFGATPTEYTPYIKDLSTAKVVVCGKNLIPFPFREKPSVWKDVTFTYKNGIVTANGTASENIYLDILPTNYRVGAGTYTISGCPKISGCLIQGRYDGKLGRFDNGDGVTFAVQQELTGLILQINAGTVLDNAVFKPMLSLASAPSLFEPYDGKVYTPEADGTITGAKSISPHMSVLTYTPDVVVQTTYNADTRKYIDKKFETLNSAILSMGGNV